VLRRQRHAVELVGEEDIAAGQARERRVFDEPVAGSPGKFSAVEPVRPQIPCQRIDPELVQEHHEVGTPQRTLAMRRVATVGSSGLPQH
jgi:hypothetical protein